MADATVTGVGESPAVDHQPFTTTPIPLGREGVNLAAGLLALPPSQLARLTNARVLEGGGVETRKGLLRLGTGVADVHSAARMNLPAGVYNRFWGAGASWYRGQSDVTGFVLLEGGFSGKPLCLVPWETELGSGVKMYVADTNKMRVAGLATGSIPIGLSKPAQPVVTVNAVAKTAIARFAASDGSSAASWIPHGYSTGSGTPVVSDIVGPSGAGILILTTPGSVADGGYISYAVLPVALNLALVGGVAATDDDLIHVWMKMNRPTHVSEVRIYLLCSPLNGGPIFPIPGSTEGFNTAAYMRAFRPSDYSTFVVDQTTGQDAQALVRANTLLEGYGGVAGSDDTGSTTLRPGADAWTELSSIGYPIRRSDFLKIGTAGDAGTDWSTITGIFVVITSTDSFAVDVALEDLYLFGGGNVDDVEPDAQPFDYRVINYDTLSGAKSNPSDVMATTVDAKRQKVTIQPVPYGRAGVVQWAYRRGGALTDDWYLVENNVADGGAILDNTTDIEALASGTVEIDNDQPITSVDAAGNAIYNQPVPILFGPVEGFLFALGDTNRPGHIYWCKRNEPDHWPAANHQAVCPASEELMNGGPYGGQAYAFSRERMYSIQVNLIDGTISSSPTDCSEGLAGRYAQCTGPGGIYFVARDSVRVTQGGHSEDVAPQLRPLFDGVATNGYNPIDFTFPDRLRLACFGDELWFGFQDSAGARIWWVYWIPKKTWRFVQFAVPTGMVYSEPNNIGGKSLIVGGVGGHAYLHSGFTDDGTVITPVGFRTGALPVLEDRAEKLLGDFTLWGDLEGSNLSVQAYFNVEKTNNAPVVIVGSAIDDRYIFDLFGATPQHAQTVSMDVSWTGVAGASPGVDAIALSCILQPEITMNRATAWKPLQNDGEVYLTGCWIDSDTAGVERDIMVEGLINGAAVTIATLTITNTGGRRQWFSWPAVHVDMVRLHPLGNCEAWMLFGQGWQWRAEPARQALWDTGLENNEDTYYTGLDIECDTFGLNKTIECYADGVLIKTQVINTPARRLVHVTFVAGRAHIYQMKATDANLGLLYSHKWILAPEPGEQSNWNQNYTIAGTHADKWLKGILLECDTFGLDKTVTIEIDGVVIFTQAVNTTGRKVVHVAFPQALGRVFRVYPTDANPGRLYSLGWLFDEEPYQLTRFETQEQPDGVDGFHVALGGQICLKSTGVVTLNVKAYGQSGQVLSTQNYALPSTAGVKGLISLHTLLLPQKGLLFKFTFTAAAGFWLYREESWVEIQPWAGGATSKFRTFGNDDLDAAREMRDAALTAARAGGAARG